jgi:predicted glycosyltransferase
MKNKKILSEVTHPKHLHQLKNLARLLEKDNEILFTARNKDVVLDLLKVSGYDYKRWLDKIHFERSYERLTARINKA